jgi:hypothetical protein
MVFPAAAAVLAAGAGDPQEIRTAAPFHAVLVTLGTTRADRLPAHGAANISTLGNAWRGKGSSSTMRAR